MSADINPDVINTSEVEENVENVQEETTFVNLAEKSLAELILYFQELMQSEKAMELAKEAEAVKSAFYKRLIKDKEASGQKIEDGDAENETVVDENDPFSSVEQGFKDLYNKYKKERAEFNRRLEEEREHNLTMKQAVIEDLKALLEKQEDVNATFPEFREIQNRWRAIGPVPQQNYRNLNETYQLYVEQFYDMVKINRELRDLDFKKNLEAKEQFCEAAEKLAENPNVIEAFRNLQKLHEEWKEFGPVAKEFRDSIWDRFKAATTVINKKYQAYFEGLKEQQAENLAKKTVLCEKVEEIADREVAHSNDWNLYSKEIEDIQKEWKSIGFASKKENDKIYARFRAACDKFYERKRVFYSEYKDGMNENLAKKISLCEAVEAIKNSTEWKKTTDQIMALQKQWKEIGAVPRKKSEAVWKRFRAACDEFFAERDKNVKPENDFYGNLKAKKHLIADINAYVPVDEETDMEALKTFRQRWSEIGFVPFKEKENIAKAYKDAIAAKFPDAGRSNRGGRGVARPHTEKERLIAKYNTLEQEIVTYENNIGFFAMSKNSEPLIKQMEEKIASAKKELETLAEQIRNIENE